MEEARQDLLNAIESTKDIMSTLEIIAKGTNDPTVLNELAVITKLVLETLVYSLDKEEK